MKGTKSFNIPKEVVYAAFKEIKANGGTYGVDEQSIKEYEENLKDNLYKLWNRMSSGTYFPKPVKAVEIPKKSGGTRILGIPTVEDRIAQMVAKIIFEPCVEPMFYKDSYGYRPKKSMKQALEATRQRCWKSDWVLEFDIKGLFDNIRHDYLMKLVEKHAKERWVVLYIERWLKVPFQMKDGTLKQRASGAPQGGVISPVLANLFLHYVFDDFMEKEFPTIQWARYADDGIAHCTTEKQAKYLLTRLQERFEKCGLEINLDKTKIIYCKDSNRKGTYKNISFNFLGYSFKPRKAKTKDGRFFISFLPAISEKASKNIRGKVRNWRLQSKVGKDLQYIAAMYNKEIQGWINHYTHFYKSEAYRVLQYLNQCLIKWVRSKFKKLKSRRRAKHWLGRIAKQNKNLFAHWKYGILPSAGKRGAV